LHDYNVCGNWYFCLTFEEDQSYLYLKPSMSLTEFRYKYYGIIKKYKLEFFSHFIRVVNRAVYKSTLLNDMSQIDTSQIYNSNIYRVKFEDYDISKVKVLQLNQQFDIPSYQKFEDMESAHPNIVRAIAHIVGLIICYLFIPGCDGGGDDGEGGEGDE